MASSTDFQVESRPYHLTTWNVIRAHGYLAIASMPIFLAFWYVGAANTDVVFSDLWGHMGMVKHFLEGNLQLGEMFWPHNQNRPFVLNVLLLASAQMDHFLVNKLIYMELLFQIVSLISLVYIAKTANVPKLYFKIIVVLSSFLLFSLGQWENYTLAINVVFASTVTFSLLSIVAWQKHLSGSGSVIAFALTLLFAELATYSMGGGVVIWAVLPLQALLHGLAGPTAKRMSFAILLAFAAASIAVYGYHLPHPVSTQSIAQQLSDPAKSIRFVLIEFGGSVLGALNNVAKSDLDLAIGGVIATLYALAIGSFIGMSWQERRDRLTIFVIMIFALGELALIWLGRGQGALQDAAGSRYMTLTNVGLPAVLMMLASRAQASVVFRVAFFLACAVCVAATFVSDRSEIKTAAHRKVYQRNLRHILESGVIGDPELTALQWPVREDVVDGLITLKKYKLNQFREKS